jgi:LysR family transcriptional regulator, hydrogen peroxide-inducible genes activator
MNIRDLEYIVALADKKRFALAASTCNVSQPALSLQIKKLEEQLGITLFQRTPQGVIPTEDAAFIIANARLVLEKTAQIKQHAQQAAKGHSVKLLTIGVIPSIAPYYLPTFFKSLDAFKGRKNLQWQILEDKTEHLVEKLDSGAIDAAVMIVPDAGTDHAHEVLFEEELYLAVSAKHPLASAREVSLQDIRNENWLLLDEGHCLNLPMLEVCKRAKIGIDRNSFRAKSLETLRHMVAHNSGITLIPAMARRKDDGIAYVSLKSTQPYTRAVSLVWRKNGLYAETINEITKSLAT